MSLRHLSTHLHLNETNPHRSRWSTTLYPLSNAWQQAEHTFPRKPAVIKSDKPFFIMQLNNKIKKCCWCGQLFRDTGSDSQYILGHQERDWYPSDNKWNVGSLQNKYYHIRKIYILQRCGVYQFPQDLQNMKIECYIPTPIKVLFAFSIQSQTPLLKLKVIFMLILICLLFWYNLCFAW